MKGYEIVLLDSPYTMLKTIRDGFLVVLAIFAASAHAQPTFVNSGFESPALEVGSFQPGFTGSGWSGEQFFYFAGISNNYTSMTQSNPPAPQGTQVAFLSQGYSVAQSIWMPAGQYYIAVKAASGYDYTGRLGLPAGLRVVRNNNQLLLDQSLPSSIYSYQDVNTQSFTVSSDSTQRFVFISLGSGMLLLDDVRIISNNPLPTVSIASPVDAQTFDLPATIPLSANASDNNGIQSVQFFSGTTPISPLLTTAPYHWNWPVLVPGNYNITVKAIDTLGGATVSGPIGVNVVENDYDFLPAITLWGGGGLPWSSTHSNITASPGDVLYAINQTKELGLSYGAVGQRLRFGVSLGGAPSPNDLFRSGNAGHVVIGLNHRFFNRGNRFAGVVIGDACGDHGGIGLEWKLENANGSAGTLTALSGGPACVLIGPNINAVVVDVTVLEDGCVSLLVLDAANMSQIGASGHCAAADPVLGPYVLPHAGIGVAGITQTSGPRFEVKIQPLQQYLIYP